MKYNVTVQEAVAGTSLAYLPMVAANFSSEEVCNHAPCRLPKMRDLILMTLGWRSFPRWGRERVASSFAYRGGEFLTYDNLQPLATQIDHDARPKIVDAPWMLTSRMGQWSCLSIGWLQRRPVHPKRITTYHRYYSTITSRISECDDR